MERPRFLPRLHPSIQIQYPAGEFELVPERHFFSISLVEAEEIPKQK